PRPRKSEFGSLLSTYHAMITGPMPCHFQGFGENQAAAPSSDCRRESAGAPVAADLRVRGASSARPEHHGSRAAASLAPSCCSGHPSRRVVRRAAPHGGGDVDVLSSRGAALLPYRNLRLL